MSPEHLKAFVAESNKIEGITREPTYAEITATKFFLAEKIVTIPALIALVKVYQPDAVLRDKPGLDVQVGQHVPLSGGHRVYVKLDSLLRSIDDGVLRYSPYHTHQEYEHLHPFTDGNGRSGRALWLWHMSLLKHPTRLGFLHQYYYQSLQAAR